MLGLEPSTADEANLILVEMHSSSIRIEICICLKQTVIFLSIEIVLSEYFSSFRYSDFQNVGPLIFLNTTSNF